MRLRNVIGASEKISNSLAVINEPFSYRGKYKEIFNNNNPIHLEIGTGKGDFIINMALKYPDINFIGIEKYDSVLIRAVEKIKEPIKNLRFIKIDALEIEKIFNQEIEKIYLNFSDPWPKNRHENRRLTSTNFLNKYDSIFKNKKTIIQKTDNRKFFEFSLISYVSYGYKIEDISLNLYQDDLKDNIATEYEKKFVARNINIYKVEVTKD